jgi:hypothetical protein
MRYLGGFASASELNLSHLLIHATNNSVGAMKAVDLGFPICGSQAQDR